jgi:putative toxin-antitoxin system antitoxin component (TIGR02293 family)
MSTVSERAMKRSFEQAMCGAYVAVNGSFVVGTEAVVTSIDPIERVEMSKKKHIESAVRGRTVGLRSNELRHVLQRIASGLPYQAVEKLQAKSGLSLTDVARVTGIPIRTMARRKDVGKLRPVESERLLRLTFIFEQAVDLFEGNSDAARDWLETSNAALGGETPLRLAETEIGAREVENLIGRLEHGVFS